MAVATSSAPTCHRPTRATARRPTALASASPAAREAARRALINRYVMSGSRLGTMAMAPPVFSAEVTAHRLKTQVRHLGCAAAELELEASCNGKSLPDKGRSVQR